MNVENVRNELRHGASASLGRRRKVAVLAALGLADFALVALYQMGVLRRLPDVPSKWFDSNRVNASKSAYVFGIPDGATGAAWYGLVLMLAAARGSRQSGRTPAIDVAFGLCVAGGGVTALLYLRDMLLVQKRACVYCLAGAALNFSMLPFAWVEARAGARELLEGRRRA